RRAVCTVLPPRLPHRPRVHARHPAGRGAGAGGAGAGGMTTAYASWRDDGWNGWIDPAAGVDARACFAATDVAAVRQSRHATTARVVLAGTTLFVKRYGAPEGWRALRAFRMGQALREAGFGAPVAVVAGRRGGEGVLVTRDTRGDDLVASVTRARDRRTK